MRKLLPCRLVILVMVVVGFFRAACRAPLRARTRMALLLALLTAGFCPAQLTRVANSTLTLPQNPQTFGYRTEAAFPGITFNQPLGLATAPGESDRLYVLEKPGRVQVITGVGSSPAKQLFLDLTSRVVVSDSTEEGLLGLAFHPNFAANRYFYVFYTTNTITTAGSGRHDRLSRFTALPSPATNADILATEVPLISQRDEASNHNGGDLHFGPDGYLYVALGDEGGGDDQFGNSQRIDRDFFAGLLRIDVDQRPGNLAPNSHASVHPGTYSIPADNPLVGATLFNGVTVAPTDVRTEFWAVGLRNPWRFTIDAPTGRVLVGDVGQNAREEIDLVTRGGNYGWNYREGTIAGPRSNPPATATFINPIWDVDRNGASSITGGVVYRGSRFAQLFERYVFGDYPSGRILAMTFLPGGSTSVQQITTDNTPVGFGLDPSNGDVLFASIGTSAIKRLVYNSTPTGTPLPATLTATGAFANVAALEPAAGVVPYEPNVSFWSDYAKKRRWFSVPALADKITFAAAGNWTFPAGTVWVKHFELELTRGDPSTARRLETRFIVKTAGGAYGVTYRWNTAQTEATLVPEEGASETITINDGGTLRSQTWRYPSRAECLQCHTLVGGSALSFNTAQLNRTAVYGAVTANQLTALADAGYFASPPPAPATLPALAPASDLSASLEHRVRSYLAANCVQCHQPGGAAQGYWDARMATPTASAGLIDGPLVDSAGDSANRVIKTGDTAHSMLLARISKRGAGQMPPLASNELDQGAIALVTSWIAGVQTSPPAIAAQPVDQTVPIGASATFTANATGTPAPAYQWKKNGVDIPGATGPSYTVASAQPGDAGVYSVVASNSAGSTTSNFARLNVIAMVLGQRDLWLMNGTANQATVTLGIVNPGWQVVGSADFNSDGHADILWQNPATGQRTVWLMNGSAFIRGVELGFVDVAWRIAGTADFNNDGQSDILWQNTVTGGRSIWLMNGTSLAGGVDLGIVAPAWRMVAAADFNQDNRPDILWQNLSTGQRMIWLMNGTARSSTVELATTDVGWQMVAAADLNRDGHTDIMWQNSTTGQRRLWLMNRTSFSSAVELGFYDPGWRIAATGDFNQDGSPDLIWQNVGTGTKFGSGVELGTLDPAWQMVAAADFNQDGFSDILWQNISTGQRVVWLMNGTALAGGIDLGVVDPAWQIAGAADLSQDGSPDILWQNSNTGQRAVWLMNGTNVAGSAELGFVDTAWRIAAAADFNSDGNADLVWQNIFTGQRVLWLMNGTTLVNGIDLGLVDHAWQIAAAADFNGDGHADILWQNPASGQRSIWLMTGTTYFSSVDLGLVDGNWQMAAAADFDGNDTPDILWQNNSTGQRSFWLMNGSSY